MRTNIGRQSQRHIVSADVSVCPFSTHTHQLLCFKKVKANLYIYILSGASYADSLRFQRCIDLWRLALQVRISRHSILHSDTCFTAQSLVRLMLDLQDKYIDVELNEIFDKDVLRFEDVFGVFSLLTCNITGKRNIYLYDLFGGH